MTTLLADAPFRLTLGGQVGFGNIRHSVEFPMDKMCKASATGGTQTCVDTLAGGPFLIGPTFGFFYELGDTVDLIVAVNSAAGRPEVHAELRHRRRHRLSHLAFGPTCSVSLTRQIC